MNLGASPMLLIADRQLICLVSILNVVVAEKRFFVCYAITLVPVC